MAPTRVPRPMRVETAVQVALLRLFAIRHGRDVPYVELVRALEEDGIPEADAERALRGLQAQRSAVETPQGWRPAAAPRGSRASGVTASFSWLHPR